MNVIYRNFRGITVEKLIEVLSGIEPSTKVCIDILNDNFPVKTVEECVYYNWDNGKKINEFKGILFK